MRLNSAGLTEPRSQLTYENFVHNFWVALLVINDDVIKWKHFPRYWPFAQIIHRSPMNSPHKGQWRGALMFSLICARISGWVQNREAGDLRPIAPIMTSLQWICQAFTPTCTEHHLDGLVQERRNSSALAMEYRISWADPSIWMILPPCWVTCHYDILLFCNIVHELILATFAEKLRNRFIKRFLR